MISLAGGLGPSNATRAWNRNEMLMPHTTVCGLERLKVLYPSMSTLMRKVVELLDLGGSIVDVHLKNGSVGIHRLEE